MRRLAAYFLMLEHVSQDCAVGGRRGPRGQEKAHRTDNVHMDQVVHLGSLSNDDGNSLASLSSSLHRITHHSATRRSFVLFSLSRPNQTGRRPQAPRVDPCHWQTRTAVLSELVLFYSASNSQVCSCSFSPLPLSLPPSHRYVPSP